MPKCIPEQELQAIRSAVPVDPDTATTQQIAHSLQGTVPLRTLQYRLRHLVDAGLIERQGDGRWVRYHRPPSSVPRRDVQNRHGVIQGDGAEDGHATEPAGQPDARFAVLSPRGAALRTYLRAHPVTRRYSGARRRLLENYRPNVTTYLRRSERGHLATLGAHSVGAEAPGTAARRLGESFQLDLILNASRISGSRYRELEVRRLVKFGRAADGRDPADTQLVLNHRDALRFLLMRPEAIELDRVALCNLHAILGHNLLVDESSAGSLRHIDERSPRCRAMPTAPAAVSMDAMFQRMIDLAGAIADPLEQAFFVFAQIPYLAPFEAMSDRVARLAVNIPLIRNNLVPLSFVDIPADLHADAIRGVVERSRVDLLRDLFIWGYEQSIHRYAGAGPRRSPADPFRLEHDADLRTAVAELVRARVPRHGVSAALDAWTRCHIAADVRERFQRIVHVELRDLHEGNFARYAIALEEFNAWQASWSGFASAHG